MSKFTKGPWALETVPTSCGVCHKVGPFPPRRSDSRPRHACLYSDYHSEGNPADAELLANARLIAAAPTMHKEMTRYLPVLERLESDPELWSSMTEGTGIATLNGYRAALAKATGATK